MGHRVTIAGGTSALASALVARLGDGFDVRRVSTSVAPGTDTWPAELTSIAEAEVACAGARTLVVLARTPRSSTWRFRGAPEDLDRLMADALARAARRCPVEHLVLYACSEAEGDVRAPLLRASGVPVSILFGGGPDPAEHLAALVRRGPGKDVHAEAWSAPPLDPARPRRGTGFSSVHHFPRPRGWSAAQLAEAYLRWLAAEVPTVRVESSADADAIRFLGSTVLVLRRLAAEAEKDSVVWSIVGGTLARPGGRMELRVLLDGVTAAMHVHDFHPTLPGPIYSRTQAFVHERVVQRFIRSL